MTGVHAMAAHFYIDGVESVELRKCYSLDELNERRRQRLAKHLAKAILDVMQVRTYVDLVGDLHVRAEVSVITPPKCVPIKLANSFKPVTVIEGHLDPSE